MQLSSLLSLVAALTIGSVSVTAAPLVEPLAETTCGSTYYTATQVNQAAQKACTYYQAGSAAGGYPHTYNNYEGFTFVVSGPYLEFPLLSSGSVYTGGETIPNQAHSLIVTSGSYFCDLVRIWGGWLTLGSDGKGLLDPTGSSLTHPANSGAPSRTPVQVVITLLVVPGRARQPGRRNSAYKKQYER